MFAENKAISENKFDNCEENSAGTLLIQLVTGNIAVICCCQHISKTSMCNNSITKHQVIPAFCFLLTFSHTLLSDGTNCF